MQIAPLPIVPADQVPPPVVPTALLIGRAVAAAAGALGVATHEHLNGGASEVTKQVGGDRIADLFWLKQRTADEIENFEQVARESGCACMRGVIGPATPDSLITTLVDNVIEILGKVVETVGAQLN